MGEIADDAVVLDDGPGVDDDVAAQPGSGLNASTHADQDTDVADDVVGQAGVGIDDGGPVGTGSGEGQVASCAV